MSFLEFHLNDKQHDDNINLFWLWSELFSRRHLELSHEFQKMTSKVPFLDCKIFLMHVFYSARSDAALVRQPGERTVRSHHHRRICWPGKNRDIVSRPIIPLCDVKYEPRCLCWRHAGNSREPERKFQGLINSDGHHWRDWVNRCVCATSCSFIAAITRMHSL